jgi:hypothetical protein
MARPIEYNPEIITRSEEYIASCEDQEDEYHATRGDKSDSYQRIIRVKVPTIEGLAVHLDVSRDTLYEWEKLYCEFSDIMEKLRAKQADRLINNGLSGDYNPTIAKVLLTKYGYREGIEQTGKDGKDLIPDRTESDKALAEILPLEKK